MTSRSTQGQLRATALFALAGAATGLVVSPTAPTAWSSRVASCGAVRCGAAAMEAGDLLLEVADLTANVGDKPILKGINFKVRKGEVHAIMGPNGSGKSTFSKVIVGHPAYAVTGGTVAYNGKDLFELEPEERAQQGVFLAFQYPVEIPGVANSDFLRLATNKRRGAKGLPEYDPIEFFGVLSEKMAQASV